MVLNIYRGDIKKIQAMQKLQHSDDSMSSDENDKEKSTIQI